MRQLLVQRNKAKAKKAANIEEIRAEEMRHLVDDDDDDEEEEEEEEEDVYMYPADMNPGYRAACRASKS